jgi:hypothetical protein
MAGASCLAWISMNRSVEGSSELKANLMSHRKHGRSDHGGFTVSHRGSHARPDLVDGGTERSTGCLLDQPYRRSVGVHQYPLDHLAYGTDDLKGDARRLVDEGWRLEMTTPDGEGDAAGFAYLVRDDGFRWS